jgi:tetratricopeptide (TPR) repeat protein
MVDAFYTGAIAARVGNLALALDRLREATRLVPEEPAAWADLAFAKMRSNDLAGAAASLEKARSLAPRNGEIAFLGALLESKQGRVPETVAALRRVLEIDPANLRARYQLIQELSRDTGPDSDREIQRQLEQIMAVQPGNLLARLDMARLAAKLGNAGLLRQLLDPLQARSAAWPAEGPGGREAVARLAEAQRLAGQGDLRAAGIALAVLGNLLRQTRRRIARAPEAEDPDSCKSIMPEVAWTGVGVSAVDLDRDGECNPDYLFHVKHLPRRIA